MIKSNVKEKKVKKAFNAKSFIDWVSSTHNIFLIIAIPIIILFSNISQPGWGLDEQVHTARAWQISRFVMYPQKTSSGYYGGYIPQPLVNILEQGHTDSNSVNRSKNFFEREDLKNQSTYSSLKAVKIVSSTPTVLYDFGPTGAYNPLPYVPAAIGMRLASLFDMNVGSHIALAKFMNALFYLVIVFLALRFSRLSKIKWLIFIIALLPTSLYQASIVTADTFSIAVVLLFVSVVLPLLNNKQILDKKISLYLIASAVLMTFTKVNYILLLSLLLLVPLNKISIDRRRARFIKLSFILFLVISAGLLTILSLKYVSATGYGGAVSSTEQLRWILFHPFETILVLVRTVVIFGQGWLISIIGLFGFNTVAVPNILSSLYFIIIFLSAMYSDPIPKKRAWAILLIGITVSLSIIGVLYLSFTAIGKPTVDGIQGRYFIPCIPLLAYGFAKILPFELSVHNDKINAPLVFGGSALVIGIISIAVYSMSMYSF